MNILYLHQYFATPDSNAGTRSYEIAKRLVKNGHEVTFITSSAFLSQKYTFMSGWNFLEIEGIKLHVLHLPYSNQDYFVSRIFKFLFFSIRSTLKSLSVKSDVIFATSTPLTIAIPGIIYSKIKNTPMVFEVRDLWPELPIAMGIIKNTILIKASRILEKFAYKCSKKVIGLSPGMCEGVKGTGFSDEKIVLATNSCDTDLFDISPSIGEKYKIESIPFLHDRKLVCYTGTFGKINNVKYIVDLAVHAKSIDPLLCFVAIGSGMEKNDVVTYAKEQGVLCENLYILDPIPKKELVKLLSAASLSLSLFGPVKEMWHNSANKFFDALASQTPVAINYGGWQKDIIEEYQCGLVLDIDDPHVSVKRIAAFLKDDDAYATAKKSCYELSYHHFSRDIMAQRVENTLFEVVNDKKNN